VNLGHDLVRPETSAVEVVLKLGTAADIIVDTDPQGYPILGFVTPDFNVLIMPYSASEGGPITACDADRASDLVAAVGKYRDELQRAIAR
jgi:hypothetical protein